MEKLLTFTLLGLVFVSTAESRDFKSKKEQIPYSAINCRKHVAYLTDFGGKGDGVTSNTAAFKAAVANLSTVASDGGALLVVPPGKWLTGSFGLASHFTLYVHQKAVILGSQEESDYPLIDPLPSYGTGREAPGKRFSSLIVGTNLTDVVITGGNGTIDGQGEIWWKKFKAKQLNHTRPYLIEILHSTNLQISDLTLTNSPSWHVHPTYCTNVIIERLTILAPVTVPNTDGINPDSCSDTRIRDSFVVSGDDCIAVKSGWDQYGIAYNVPTQRLSIRSFTCISPDSAVIALGSEMSGGVRDVRAEDVHALNSQSGIRIKTGAGRGGYVKDIYVRGVEMENMKYVFWMNGDYGSHPDPGFDPKALPEISNINYKDMKAKNVTVVGSLSGIKGDDFTNICISNVTVELAKEKKKEAWKCVDVGGVSSNVTPKACPELVETEVDCAFPTDTLDIDKVELNKCSVEV
ncbi:probable polygalacturonase [Salvia hispanica]|uniref:probable polygalacturonase n=1 Tax=Salvia hispanica TaxID=49212 RepID=UPI002009B190|nr:probable polygalacturonase [Salvia hispanica]